MEILVVEDDPKLAGLLENLLKHAGHNVSSFSSVQTFWLDENPARFDLAIIDLMLPEKPGSFLVKKFRSQKIDMPILVLSAIDNVQSKSALFEMGADDYLTKPFETAELLARVDALRRRYRPAKTTAQDRIADLVFEAKKAKVRRNKKEISLTHKESALLETLLKNKGKIVRSQDLLLKIWNMQRAAQSNVLPATVRRLRQKIDRGCKQKLIHCVHGIGYVIAPKNPAGH